MPPELYQIPLTGTGQLWIMPRPRVLDRDIAAYRAAGLTHVVSMLAVAEAEELGLAREGAVCAAHGIAFTQHSIPDFGLPDMAAFGTLVTTIKSELDAGQNVGVHCRAGIGRSGMVTSGVLVVLGDTAQGAIARVAQARGTAVPDTAQQADFIAMFADTRRL